MALVEVTSFGNLFSWGQNHQGQLGDGSVMPRDTPGLLGEVLGAWGQHNDLCGDPLEFMVRIEVIVAIVGLISGE